MSKLGVVVPIYNCEKYLAKCIDSILNQSIDDLEVVLVDDGSIDSCGEICESYRKRDGRVKVIHQENQGMLRARYNGLCALECDYATTIDADDWIGKETFGSAQKYMDKKIDVISYGIIRYYGDERDVYSKEGYDYGLYNNERILSEIIPTMIWNYPEERFVLDPSLCNKIFRKDLLLKYLEKAVDLNVDYGQDVAVMYPLMTEVKSMYFMDRFLYYHRQRQMGELPGYMVDGAFCEKTYRLFTYLKEYFHEKETLLKQIEGFYAWSLDYRTQLLYGKRHIIYVFPFRKICTGRRIVLYGAGDVGKSYYDQISMDKDVEIIGWVDGSGNQVYRGVEIRTPDEICEMDFDYIVIATIKRKNIEEMKGALLNMGVVSDKIIY